MNVLWRNPEEVTETRHYVLIKPGETDHGKMKPTLNNLIYSANRGIPKKEIQPSLKASVNG